MPTAAADFWDITDYIAQDNPKRAISFIEELERKTNDVLSIAPQGGRLYKNQTRFFPIGRYIVLYEINEKKKVVEVLHIVAGATDWKRGLLDSGGL